MQTCAQSVLPWRLQLQVILIRARFGQLGQDGALPCLKMIAHQHTGCYLDAHVVWMICFWTTPACFENLLELQKAFLASGASGAGLVQARAHLFAVPWGLLIADQNIRCMPIPPWV